MNFYAKNQSSEEMNQAKIPNGNTSQLSLGDDITLNGNSMQQSGRTAEQNVNYTPNDAINSENIKSESSSNDTKDDKSESTVDKSNEDETDDKKSADVKDETIEKDAKVKDDGIPYDWAIELMKNYTPDLIENSTKMEIFFCILDETIALGDRMLIFSQSLLTLNLIERFLQANPTKTGESEIKWAKNVNYYRK